MLELETERIQVVMLKKRKQMVVITLTVLLISVIGLFIYVVFNGQPTRSAATELSYDPTIEQVETASSYNAIE